jgi:hypothetical protein
VVRVADEYVNSELCQACAECCKAWWIFSDLKDDAVRTSWLDTDKVSVVKIRDGLWKIIFHIPCSKLTDKDGKYYCKVHGGLRPGYCRTYPNNFLEENDPDVLAQEKRFCPALKKRLG